MVNLKRKNTTQLKPEYIGVITDTAQQYEEIEHVILFGSWAIGNAKPGSDIDLAIVGNKIDSRITSDFHSFLEEKTLIPNFFDVIHYDSLSNPQLLKHIDEEGIEIFRKNSRET